MGRGDTPGPAALPKVQFTRVEDAFSDKQAGVHDQQARSYGYNDGSPFERPEHYIRYIEPLDSELAVQVEYDMDEQDQEWLDSVNADRRKEQLNKVTYEMFEIIMDRLEKEWFDLTKNLPKPEIVMPSEDSTCAICDDSEGENTNAIVFCDGCNLAVHQDCYGVPYIPEGQWLCRKCTVSPENPVSCILCPNEGGAFKQTVNGEWVHLLCAIWVPETAVANDVFMEPVTGVDKIPKQRWKLKCSVCDIREGACIQCIKPTCFSAFHATCARREKFLMPMKATHGSEAPVLACYCERHLPREQYEAREKAFATERRASEEIDVEMTPKANKTARAYAKTYKPGPPLVPNILVERLMQYVGKVDIRHKREFVCLVCKYWSLKREARRGAPLLKRLHLEPWTASTGTRYQSDEEKIIKLEFMKQLKQDLERVMMLARLSEQREIAKRTQAEIARNMIAAVLFPHDAALRFAFEKITAADRKSFFKTPVSKTEVPDYYDVIKNPICWDTIDQKLDRHEYWDIQAFKDDIHLVLDNATTYNQPDTAIYNTAMKIKSTAERWLSELDKLAIKHFEVMPVQPAINGEGHAEQLLPFLGNLEPPMMLLNLLVDKEDIQEQMDLLLEAEPVVSLFDYRLPVYKPRPPTPPPPPPPPPSKAKKKGYKRIKQLSGAALRSSQRAAEAAAARAAISQEGLHEDAVEEPDMQLDTQMVGGTPTEERPRKRTRRGVHILPGQAEVPPVVDDVDGQQSFKMFDAGWILPEDHKRRGRAPVDRTPLPPRKKKAGREKSVVSGATMSVTGEEMASSAMLPADDYHEQPPWMGLPQEHLPQVQPLQEPPLQMQPPDDQLPTRPPEEQLSEEPIYKTIIPDKQVPTDQLGEEPVLLQEQSLQTLPPPYSLHQPLDQKQPLQQYPQDQLLHALPDIAMEVSDHRKGEPISTSLSEPIQTNDEVVTLAPSESISTFQPVVREQDPTQPPILTIDPATGIPLPFVPDGPISIRKEIVYDRRGPPRQVTIIEELDTPAIRRAKYLKRREERIRQALAGQLEVQQPIAGSSRVQVGSALEQSTVGADDELASLSSLSQLSEEEASDAARSRHPSNVLDGQQLSLSARSRPRQVLIANDIDWRGQVILEDGKTLEGGTLVWAKAATYPWWPAVIFEHDDPMVPEHILQLKTPEERGSNQFHLARFFDNASSWGWFSLDQLRLLGEDHGLDGDMLSTSKMQRWKTPRVKDQCRRAYRRAVAEMEDAREAAGSETQS